MTTSFRKYFITFIITLSVFVIAILVSNYLNNKKVAEIQSIEDRISIDILSSETQFDLLRESSCSSLNDSILSRELNELATRLSYMETERGIDDSEVVRLKRYYSLLEIKDYMLLSELNEKCGYKPISILYFYSNKETCEDCKRISYVLSYLREQYPALRVYSFDYDLDLSAVQTIIALNKVENRFPSIIIENKPYYGFKSVEEIETLMPELRKSLATTTAATSTASTTNKKVR